MAWKKLEINLPDLNTGDLVDIIKKLKELLASIVDILETILTFIAAMDDPYAAAIKAAVEMLKKTVESLLEDVGGYLLFVPIRKRLMTNFMGLGDITPSWAGELGIFGSESSQVKWDNPELGEFLSMANRYNGGNMGFFKTVIDSLYDLGDTNRPQFTDDDDYVGGIVLVMGTSFDPLGLLDDIWKLVGMFDGPDTLPKVPRPKGLKGRTVVGPNGGKFTALLSWDPPEVPIYSLEDLGGVILYPSRYAIMRGKNTVGALSALSVVDLMGKRDLQKGDTFLNDGIEVVLEDGYDISKVSYLDIDVPAAPDDSFYYAVAWKLKAFHADEPIKENTGIDIDYWYISNVVRLTPYPTIAASTPPDWYRTPSIASIFPALAEVLRKMVAQIENFANKLLGASEMLENYITFLKNEILRYEKIINDILDAIAALITKFELPTSGVYYRVFKGKGGNDFFITDLAKSFLPSEPNYPPFNRGDEFVMGAVVMTGGNIAMVEAFIEGLSWIFGGKSSSSGLDDSIAQLGEAVTQAEQVYFSPNFESSSAVPKTKPSAMPNMTSCSSTFAAGPVYEFDATMGVKNVTS